MSVRRLERFPWCRFAENTTVFESGAGLQKKALLFFVGDRLNEEHCPPVICQYQQEDYLLRTLRKKFPHHNVHCLIEPESFTAEGYGCYNQFLEKVSKYGDPLGYHPQGRKATLALHQLLKELNSVLNSSGSSTTTSPNCALPDSWRLPSLEAVEIEVKEKNSNTSSGRVETSPSSLTAENTNTIGITLAGFSRGGVVLNQILAELCHCKMQTAPPVPDFPSSREDSTNDPVISMNSLQKKQNLEKVEGEEVGQWLPESLADMASLWAIQSIESLHYVDAGANGIGAFYCEPRPLAQLRWNLAFVDRSFVDNTDEIQENDRYFYVTLTGTWRQWGDIKRPHLDNERLKLHYWLNSNKIPCSMKFFSKEQLPDAKYVPLTQDRGGDLLEDEEGRQQQQLALGTSWKIVSNGPPEYRGLLAHMQAIEAFEPTKPTQLEKSVGNGAPVPARPLNVPGYPTPGCSIPTTIRPGSKAIVKSASSSSGIFTVQRVPPSRLGADRGSEERPSPHSIPSPPSRNVTGDEQQRKE